MKKNKKSKGGFLVPSELVGAIKNPNTVRPVVQINLDSSEAQVIEKKMEPKSKRYVHETGVAEWLLESPPKEFDYVTDPMQYAWWTLHVMIEAFKDQYYDASWNTVTHHIFEDLNLWDVHLEVAIQDIEGILAGATHVPSSGLGIGFNSEPTEKEAREIWKAILSFLKMLRTVPKEIRTFYHTQVDRNQGHDPMDFDDIASDNWYLPYDKRKANSE